MNRTRLLTITLIGLLLLNFGTLGVLLIRRPPHPAHGEMPPPNGEGPKQIIIERLHFDEAQQKQYEALVKEHHAKTNELHDASRKLHDTLYSLLKSNAVDTSKSKADELIQQIADNQKAIDNLNIDHFQKIKNICRPEQLKDFDLLVDDLTELFAPKGPPRR